VWVGWCAHTHKIRNPDFDATARRIYDTIPLETAPTEPIVSLLREVILEMTGEQQPLVGVPYWTDGALLSSSVGIPTRIFGPGDIGVAHSPDEYVNLDDVLNSARIYRRICERFCS
jgi:acetylornithine deacetylase/succinyl-diaminopimelate desuccinylase-like protein